MPFRFNQCIRITVIACSFELFCLILAKFMHFVRLPMTIPGVEKAGWRIVTKDCGKDSFFKSLNCSTSVNSLELD